MRFGIGFGTTRTVVAAVQDGRHPIAAFDDRDQLAPLAHERRPDLQHLEIADRYTYAPDGTIEVHIENVSRGYARTYELGALR